ncbi:MAG: MGMT family protein [Acidimicrobiia bacterium]|nr:MGMT family protein [Acidimicrobiia bacterium]
MDFEDNIREILLGLAPGEVVTYGEIAAQAGRPGAARAVGNFLRKSTGLPWWRVVASSGRLVPGLEERHAEHLRSEGVELRNGKVAKTR